MKFLEYLYCKYYYFQVRVGNADIAPFSAMMFILFLLILYYFSISFLVSLFIPKGIVNTFYFKYFSISLFLYFFIQFYFLFLHKKKYKKILARNETKKISGLGAILFGIIGFILFNLGWILGMLQNRGWQW